MVKVLRVFLAAALLCAAATAAHAQVSRVGSTTNVIPASTRGSAVAYDSVNQVYLAVETFGTLQGRFVDKNGTALGQPFVIQGTTAFTHFPSVTFSPDADGGLGAFLVVWHASDIPNTATIHTRLVSYGKGGPIGADNQVSVEGSYWERYAPVAYSTQSRQFLIVYKKFGGGVHAVRTDINGAALAAPFIVAQTSLGEDLPGVAYNRTNDQFLVSYEGYSDNDKTGYVCVKAVQAGTDAPLGAGPTIVHAGGANFITDVTYNTDTNQYLVVWYRGVDAMLGRVVNADLSMAGPVTVESTVYKAYDGLGLAYNAITKTSFMVSHCANCNEDGGVEIRADGTPVDNGTQVTVSADGKANYYPRIAASTNDPNWLVVTSHAYLYTASQLLVGSGVGPPPPPPPPGSNPQAAIDHPSAGALTAPFMLSGWAIDLGSPTGTGVDVVHMYAWPSSGAAPIFLGAVTPSVPRPDIGATYGARFTNSGYSARISNVPVGSYTVAVYSHSTVTDTFNAVRTVNVNVTQSLGINETMRASDFDGDAKSELTVYNVNSGVWSSLKSGAGYAGASNIAWGGQVYTPVPGDYDGDGKSDLAVYNAVTGDWYALLSSTGFNSTLSRNAGGPGWVPVPGDYDGDGKTDFAVYNSTTGLWFALKSSSNYSTTLVISWGGAGYTPVPGDFDGDGRTDLGVYQQATGDWYVLASATGYTSTIHRNVGGAGYIPVQADYDGDGRTDFAVYGVSTGLWYALRSGTADLQTISVNWGGGGYAPVRGDFDGDGRADLAVYQQSSGNWYILLSSTEYASSLSKNWGGSGYIAVPAFQ